jgi:Core-2/I-Branching enzyme
VRIAYLVLTHAMPDHLGRLIGALRDDGTRFFVHVDRKVPIEPFLAHAAEDVEFLDRRVPVYWGEWQMVAATLRLMRAAMDRADPDYLVLLSGSCYPIRSPRHISRLLDGGDDLFINSVPMPNERLHKPISRLERFRFRSDRSRLANLVRVAPTIARGPSRGRRFSRAWFLTRDWRRELALPPYAGSSWWALPRDAAAYALDFDAREPTIARFFENTRNPDEAYFQTILSNSTFAARIRRNLTYADWTRAGSHPGLITPAHVERFAEPGPFIEGGPYGSGELCFARKFPDDGGAMARLVDAVIRAREPDEQDH